LPPCHCLFHFHTEELTFTERVDIFLEKYGSKSGVTVMPPEPMELEFDKIGIPRRRLNCLLYQRSNDFFLGVPFNIASYSFLTHLLAKHCGLEAYEFIYFMGNCHIYEEHLETIETQLNREPFEFPTIDIINIKDNINDYTIEDFVINNYQSHDPIKMKIVA
jgi:thymidylate synthase